MCMCGTLENHSFADHEECPPFPGWPRTCNPDLVLVWFSFCDGIAFLLPSANVSNTWCQSDFSLLSVEMGICPRNWWGRRGVKPPGKHNPSPTFPVFDSQPFLDSPSNLHDRICIQESGMLRKGILVMWATSGRPLTAKNTRGTHTQNPKPCSTR